MSLHSRALSRRFVPETNDMAELLIDEPLARDDINFHDSFDTVGGVGESTFDEVGDQQEEECNDEISLDQTHDAADDAVAASTGDQEKSEDMCHETVSALHNKKENEGEQDHIKQDGMMSPRRSMSMGLFNSLNDEITTEEQRSHRRSSMGSGMGSPKTSLHLGNLLQSMLEDEIVPTTPTHHRRSSTGTTFNTGSARSQGRRSDGGTYSSSHSVIQHSFDSNGMPQLVRSSLGSSNISKSENSSLHSLEPPSTSIQPDVEEKDADVQQRARRVLIDAFIDAPMMGDISLGTYLDQPSTNHNSKSTPHRQTSSATTSNFVGNSRISVAHNNSGSIDALRRSADGFVEDDCEELVVSILNENTTEPEKNSQEEYDPRTSHYYWNRRSSNDSDSSTIKSPSQRIKDMVPSLKIKGVVEKVRVMGRQLDFHLKEEQLR